MKILFLLFISSSSFALTNQEIISAACSDGKYLSQCFQVDQKKCENDFTVSYKSCVKLKGEKLAANCAVKDLSLKWKSIAKKNIKNCTIKEFVGDEL